MIEKKTVDTNEVGLERLSGMKKIEKSSLTRIEINALPKKLPNLKNPNETKDVTVAQWLENWINKDLSKGKISINDLLPKKVDMATYLGISVGTVQNAIRYIEDKGLVESKQRIGTLVRDPKKPVEQIRKQVSKRERAIVSLKKLIIDQQYSLDAALPSSRELSKMIGSASNTTRLALEHLASIGVIESKGSRGNKANWILRQMPTLSKEESDNNLSISTDTLVNQVERDLKDYISNNFNTGDRLPAHFELSQELKVSIKTIHDAMKRLIEQGILQAKRGRYGTTIMRMPNAAPRFEDSIFAPAEEAIVYNYEKVEQHLKLLIQQKHKIGDKLPSMGDLAKELDVSSNTVRKALQSLAKELIVEFSRGRYGGTFVTKMPKKDETAAFKWLSINPEHIKAYKQDKQAVSLN